MKKLFFIDDFFLHLKKEYYLSDLVKFHRENL